MEIKLRTTHFDADEKLAKFVEKKVSRLEKFFAGANPEAEVTLEENKEGKKAKIQTHDLIIERTADTFENAITGCVDAMKEKLTRVKEKKYDA